MFSMFGKRDTSCRCEADSEGETNSWLGVLSLTWERHRCDVMKGRQPELGVFLWAKAIFWGLLWQGRRRVTVRKHWRGDILCVIWGL